MKAVASFQSRFGHEFVLSHPLRKKRAMDGARQGERESGEKQRQKLESEFVLSQVPKCEGPGAPGLWS